MKAEIKTDKMTRDLKAGLLYLLPNKKGKKFSHKTLWMDKRPATEFLPYI